MIFVAVSAEFPEINVVYYICIILGIITAIYSIVSLWLATLQLGVSTAFPQDEIDDITRLLIENDRLVSVEE